MAQRLVRAKAKIRAAGIPYRTPPRELLDERCWGVLAAIYLVFTEAYARDPRQRPGDRGDRPGAPAGRAVAGAGRGAGPARAHAAARARRPARYDAAGDLVLLEDQDRGLWNGAMIAEGLALVERR